MNKKSHLIFTGQMDIEISDAGRKFLQIGSILPDILVHTYLTGHTWDTSGKRVLRKLEKIADTGVFGLWSSLRFGMLLHYLEDYFTVAHSRFYEGDIKDHIRYEKKLSGYLQAHNPHKDSPETVFVRVHSAGELSECIVSLQDAYQQEIRLIADNEDKCIKTDLTYMRIAVKTAIEYAVSLNQRRAEPITGAISGIHWGTSPDSF